MNHNLKETLIWLGLHYPFYHEILLSVSFVKDNCTAIAAIEINRKEVTLKYNEGFMDDLKDVRERAYILVHKVLHLLHHYNERKLKRHPQLATIAGEMIINTLIRTHHPHLQPPSCVRIPQLPEGYSGRLVFEELYGYLRREMEEGASWLMKMLSDPDPGSPSDSSQTNQLGTVQGTRQADNSLTAGQLYCGAESDQSVPSDSQQTNQPVTVQGTRQAPIMLTAGQLHCEVEPEVKSAMVERILERCRGRGLIAGQEESILKILRVPERDYLKRVRQCLSGSRGRHKRRTWQRPNRRGLPLKGYRKKREMINVILDTSASMEGHIEEVLGCLYSYSREIRLIQIDSEIQSVKRIRSKSELKRLKVRGKGGTRLQPAIDLILTKYNCQPTVILTDGYCDRLTLRGLRKPLIVLTRGVPIDYTGKERAVRQIVL